MPVHMTIDELKSAARTLRKFLAESGAAQLTHAQSLEAVAHTAGFRDWNSCSAALLAPRPLAAVPILRVYDEVATRNFYCDYLGFEVDFEHRFAADLPLYMRVTRGGGPVCFTVREEAWVRDPYEETLAELEQAGQCRLRDVREIPYIEEEGSSCRLCLLETLDA